MKYFDMFAGIGGFSLGINSAYGIRQNKTESRDRAGIKSGTSQLSGCPFCVGFSEINKYAIQVYQNHFPTHKNYGDCTTINTAELPDFDLLTFGFPCQSFSIAGKRKGFDDTRGTLFFEAARILRDKRPKNFVGENVKGLISHDKGKTFEIILETFQELGYYVNVEIYNSKSYGVPQNRERLFFIGYHISSLCDTINDGQNQKTNLSEKIISQWLFQILLNNLKEAQKLQEAESKDWVLGWLILKEIIKSGVRLNLKSLKTIWKRLQEKSSQSFLIDHSMQLGTNASFSEEENIRAGIMMIMEENKLELKVEDIWQNIAILWSNISEESSRKQNMFTISTEIKQITELKTFTYTQMFQAISLATYRFRALYRSLWNEILSNLILVLENTNYARINNKTEKVIITENGTAYEFDDFSEFINTKFILDSGGYCGRKIFPFGEEYRISGKESGREQKDGERF